MVGHLAAIVAIVALVLSVFVFVVACVDLIQSWTTASSTKAALKNAAEIAKRTNPNSDELEKQSAVDFKGSWEALAKLAAGLKDLDRSSRLFVISLAFLAVAAVAAGTGEFSSAVAS